MAERGQDAAELVARTHRGFRHRTKDAERIETFCRTDGVEVQLLAVLAAALLPHFHERLNLRIELRRLLGELHESNLSPDEVLADRRQGSVDLRIGTASVSAALKNVRATVYRLYCSRRRRPPCRLRYFSH